MLWYNNHRIYLWSNTMTLDEEFLKELKLLKENGLKDSPLRLEYEEKVRNLKDLETVLRKQGLPEKEIAYTLHNKRREIGKVYKEAAPPLFQEYIYIATANKYGDPLGPTFEQLAERKTYAQIIESSSRPIADLDNRLTVDGFIEWYRKKKRVV